MLTPGIASAKLSDVAFAAGKVLVAYEGVDRTAVGRLYDVQTQELGPPFEIAPPGTVGAWTQVQSTASRFLIVWKSDDTRRDVWYGRWVSPQGEAGPIRRLPIDGAFELNIQLRPDTGKIVALFNKHYSTKTGTWTSVDGCKVWRYEIDGSLDALRSKSQIGDFPRCSSLPTATTDGKEEWVVLSAKVSQKEEATHTFLIRVDESGRPIGEPRQLSKAECLGTSNNRILHAAAGVLVAWQATTCSRSDQGGVFVVALDEKGKPRNRPRQVPEAPRDQWYSLNMSGSVPYLLWGVHAMPLGWDGRAAGTPMLLASRNATWVSTGESTYWAWTETRHAHEEVYLAPARCGGSEPAITKFARPLKETDTAPLPPTVPDPAFTCRSYQMSSEQIIKQGHFLAASKVGNEIWEAWENAEYGTPAGEDASRALSLLRMRLPGLEIIGPPAIVRSVPAGGLAGNLSSSRMFVFSEQGNNGSAEVKVIRFRDDGSAVMPPQTVSDPLSYSSDPWSLASGDETGVLWQAGRQESYLEFRTIRSNDMSPIIQLAPLASRIYMGLAVPRGFVVGWRECGACPLQLARLETNTNPRVVWKIDDRGDENDNKALGNIIGMALVDEQLFVLAQRRSAPVVDIHRYTLDGARLAVFHIRGIEAFDAILTNQGIFMLADRDLRAGASTLYRFTLDGKQVGEPTRFRGASSSMLLRAEGGLYSLTHEEGAVAARRWACTP